MMTNYINSVVKSDSVVCVAGNWEWVRRSRKTVHYVTGLNVIAGIVGQMNIFSFCVRKDSQIWFLLFDKLDWIKTSEE